MFELIIPAQAATTPSAPAVFVGDSVHSYEQLASDIDAWARWLLTRGFRQHSRILVNVDDPYLFYVLIFALERVGLVGVLQASGISSTEARLRFLRVEGALSTAASPQVQSVAWVQIGRGWRDVVRKAPTHTERQCQRSPSDPIWILLSSGTTGENKKVMLTRNLIDQRLLATSDTSLQGNSHRALSLIPCFTVGGCAIFLYAMLQGGSVAYKLPEDGWEKTLNRPTFDAILAAPAHLAAMLRELPGGFAPDRPLTVTVGGGVLSKALASETRRRLTEEIYVAYASTEFGVITQGHVDQVYGVSEAAGHVFAQADVEIVDADDRPVPSGASGEIRVRGIQTVKEYVDDENASAQHFRNGWYYTGDWGSLSADKMLTVHGRVDDLLNIGGKKVQASAIEKLVAAHYPKLDVAAFSATAYGEYVPRIWLVFEDASGSISPADIANACALPSDCAVAQIDVIPRNQMGKVEKRSLEAYVADGTLGVQHLT